MIDNFFLRYGVALIGERRLSESRTRTGHCILAMKYFFHPLQLGQVVPGASLFSVEILSGWLFFALFRNRLFLEDFVLFLQLRLLFRFFKVEI